MESTPDYNPNILDDIGISLHQASGGKRFANYLIDLVAFYLFMIVLGFVLAMVAPGIMQEYVGADSAGRQLELRLYSVLLYILFMWVLEMAARGKTLGKLITGTRAVNDDGTRISPKTALLRSLSRIVPFEAFSA